MFADLGQTYNSSSTLDHIAASLADNPMTGAAPHFVYASVRPSHPLCMLCPLCCLLRRAFSEALPWCSWPGP